MRKESDSDPDARGAAPLPGRCDPARVQRAGGDTRSGRNGQPSESGRSSQPGKSSESGENGRSGRSGESGGSGLTDKNGGNGTMRYLRRHAWAVARLLVGSGALAMLGTLRGEVPLLFALLALWGAGELLAGAFRPRH